MPFLLGTGVGLRPKPPYGQDMSASTSASGALGKGLVLALAAFTALCTATSTSAKTTLKALAAILSVTVTVLRTVGHTLATTMTATVGRAQRVTHTVAATITTTVSTLRAVAHTMAVACVASVSTAWATTTARASTLTATPAFSKALFLLRAAFTASLGAVNAYTRGIGKALTATVTGTVSRTQQLAHMIAATCTITLSLARAPLKILSSEITGAVVQARNALKALASSAPLLPVGRVEAHDTFSRANQSGWGTASDGNTWTQIVNAPTLAISATRGTLVLNFTSVQALGPVLVGPDADACVRVTPQTTGDTIGVAVCIVDSTHYVSVTLDSTGNFLSLKSIMGASTNTSSFSFSWLGGATYWVRVHREGAVLYGRAWADGTVEPSSWTGTYTPSLGMPGSGRAGLIGKGGTSTNVLSYDSFSAAPYPRAVPTFQTARTLAATMTGTVARAQTMAKALSSTLIQAVTRVQLALARATFTTSLGGTVALLRTTGKDLLATCASVGARTQDTAHAIVATCQATVSRTQQLAHVVAATLTPAPALAKALILALATFASSVGASASLARATGKALAALCTGAVTRMQQVTHTLAAPLTGRVLLARQTAHALVAATLTTSAALLRTAQKALAALLRADPYPLGTMDCADTFARADQSGWGTASDGNTWSATTLTTAITGNEGTATGSTSLFVTTLGVASATSDQEVLVRLKASALPVNAGPVARMVDNQTWIAATINSFGGVGLFESRPGNSFNNSLGGSVSAGAYYWIRLRVVGTQAWVRSWADGQPEPVSWNSNSPVDLHYATNTGKAGLLTWLSDAGDTLSVDTFSATPVLSTPPAWQLSKALASTCTATVSFAKAIAGLARTVFSANLPPAPGALLSNPSQQDTFTRADQSGWGTASDGESWSTNGTSPTLAISSNRGTILAAGGVDRILGTPSYAALEAVGRFSVKDANGQCGISFLGGSSYESAYLSMFGAGTLTLSLINNGVVALSGLVATDTVWIRLRLHGGGVYAKAWKDGNAEPGSWTKTGIGYSTGPYQPAVSYSRYLGTPTTIPSQVDSFSVTELAPLSKNPTKALSSTITATIATLQRTFAFARSAFAGGLRPYVAVVHEDTFSRADQAGWGTASDGELWALRGNAGSPTLAIASNAGTYTGTTSALTYGLGANLNYRDAELLARFKVSSTAGSGSTFVLFLYTDTRPFINNNYCKVTIFGHQWGVDSGSDNGSSSLVGNAGVSTISAGILYWVRLRRASGTVQAHVWADGATEPAVWNTITTTLATVPSGPCGLGFQLNSTSDTVTVDNFSVVPYPSLAPDFTRTFDFLRSRLAATLTPTTASVRAVLKSLAASTIQTALLSRRLAKTLVATLTSLVTRTQQIGHRLAASIAQAASLARALDGLARTVFAPLLVPLPGALLSTPSQQDTFARPDQSGWGTASDGETWHILGSASTLTLSVSGGEGTLLESSDDFVDTIVLGTQTWPGGEVLARTSAQADNVGIGVQLQGDGPVARFQYTLAGGTDLLWNALSQADFAYGFIAGQSALSQYWVRLRVVGLTAMAKIWADGSAEPVDWTATIAVSYDSLSPPGLRPSVWYESAGGIPHAASTIDSFSFYPLVPLTVNPAKGLAATALASVTYAKELALALATFASSLRGTATVARTPLKTLAATVTGTVTRTQQAAHALAALCLGQVQMARAILSSTRSHVTHAAHLQRGTVHGFLTSSLTSAAQLTRRTLRILGNARITSLAVLARQTHVLLGAVLRPSLLHLARASTIHLVAILRTLALLGKRGPPVLLFAAVSTLGALRRQTMLVFPLRSARIVGAGARPVRASTKALRAQTLLAGTLARRILHALDGLLSTAVLLGRGRYYALAATLQGAGALARRTLHESRVSLDVLADLGRASIRQIAVHLDLDLGMATTVTLSRDVAHGLGATLVALSRVGRASASHLSAQIIPSAVTAGIYSAFLPLVRATLVPIVRLLTLLARTRAQTFMVPTRVSAFLAGTPERAFTPQERTRVLVVVRSGGPMIAVPSRAGASAPYLSPDEEHVSFTIDVSSIVPTGLHITHVNTLSVTTKLPGAPDSAAVLASLNFLLPPLLSGTTITLVAGDGTQVLGMETEIELQIVLNNTPATKETLYVTLPCRKG